jgi:LmbE family N-acetylglucosaminyl deacetylase
MHHNLAPPTQTTPVLANRVLVLAPHYDDEIFGCGGLLAQLSRAQAEIRVLYLTDSSGGDEVRDDRETYAARRRTEAQRALDILGITQLEVLPIADGRLAERVELAAEAITRSIGELRPDLLLSVSPCEITADHRAAFAALHRTLSPLRGGGELDRIMDGCRTLLYEVNHPGFPDLLVDVSNEIELLTAAIDAHASQLELHNYREAALGMRHFRALSLPASVTAAEGYRKLATFDAVSHGLGALVARLGGVPDAVEIHDGPLVSVVVRTKDRLELLAEALDSIGASSYRRVEVVLVNDGGAPPEVPAAFPFPVVRVEMDGNQGRAAAATAGVEAATGDYLCFLDDDDLMGVEHLATLVGLVSASGVRIAYTDAAVGVYELDPVEGWREVDRRLPYSRDFDPELLLVDNYIPFNTLLIERKLALGTLPFSPELDFFEDWDFLIRLSAHTPFHHLARVTAEYRHFRGSGHHILGDDPQQRADFLERKAEVISRHSDRVDPALLARVVDRLRSETVQALDIATDARRELDGVRTELAEWTDAYHRANGEREALRGEKAMLIDKLRTLETELDTHRRAIGEARSESERARAREQELDRVFSEQVEQIGKLYAEIERLGELIEAMESTKAWKWHQRLEKLRGR